MPNSLTPEEKQALLKIAREAITARVKGESLPALKVSDLSPALQEEGASFVTLTRQGSLRGCIGTLQAYQSLAQDVQLRAVQAATSDPRFRPVSPSEIDTIHIEISRLTSPEPLFYEDPAALPSLLHPGEDGVVLSDGFRQATFLPQVWDELPEPEDFLSHLCAKMGASPNLWREKLLQVSIYHVEKFEERETA